MYYTCQQTQERGTKTKKERKKEKQMGVPLKERKRKKETQMGDRSSNWHSTEPQHLITKQTTQTIYLREKFGWLSHLEKPAA